MKLPREKPQRELINITPLIDVVFILLVFFMLAGTIEPDEAFPVDPTSSNSDIRGDVKDILVLVNEDGQVALGEKPVTIEQLEEDVHAELTARPDALIQIKPDSQAEAVKVIAAMDAIRDAGAQYVVMLTVSPDEDGAS